MNLFLSLSFLFLYFDNAVRCKHTDSFGASYIFLQNPLIVEYFETLKSFCYGASYILASKTLKGHSDVLWILSISKTLKGHSDSLRISPFSKTLKGHSDVLRTLSISKTLKGLADSLRILTTAPTHLISFAI